jgi:DNA mismatch repair protein MutS
VSEEPTPSQPPPAMLTPMLRQYAEAKAQAKDALLFFRLGDFYELFFEDARTASQLLGITLTARSKGDDRVPMAGVPFHAARGYIARLVAAGHKVAICDQMEAPAPGKTLVKREIVRLVTPGTLLDDDALDAREPLVLAAVALEQKRGDKKKNGVDENGLRPRGALALLDASTGDLRAQPAGSWEALLGELARSRPRELLVPEEIVGTRLFQELKQASGAIRVEPRAMRDAAGAELLLKKHLGLGTLDGLGLQREPLATQACAEALVYLQETQRSAARHVVRVQLDQPSRALWLDPSAVKNLELFHGPDGRRGGTLCALVDRTHTAAGGRMLARWLSAPLVAVPAIAARHDGVEELSAAAVIREELAAKLKTILDIERLLGRLAIRQGTPRELAGLRASLRELPGLSKQLSKLLSNRLRELAPPLAALGSLSDLLERSLADEIPPAREPGFVRPGFRASLDEWVDLAQGGRALIAALEASEKARSGIQSLKVRYNRVSGFYIEITKSNLHLVPSDYQRRSSTVGAERFITKALGEHESKVLAAEERRAALETEIFDELVQAVLAQSEPLRSAAAAAAEVDVLLSFARIAAESGWVRPSVDDEPGLDIRGGRHPVVEKALQLSGEGPFVPNDIALDAQRRLIVLTGPNMAGKSTAMRQVALIAILAQSGSFVPAASARIGVVDKLFTRVGAADDLARGQSTFMVEMAECARILAQATERSLLILDEVGRGTSTFDGLAIAWAVAEHLHDKVKARTLFATHYHELCDLAAERSQVVNFTMAVTEVEGKVVFLRKVIPGAASRSYGIHVAKLAGLPGQVVERAREILANLESQELDDAGHAAIARGPISLQKPRPQLGLFEPQPSPPPALAREEASEGKAANTRWRKLETELRAADLSRMTPLEALVFLDGLKRRL